MRNFIFIKTNTGAAIIRTQDITSVKNNTITTFSEIIKTPLSEKRILKAIQEDIAHNDDVIYKYLQEKVNAAPTKTAKGYEHAFSIIAKYEKEIGSKVIINCKKQYASEEYRANSFIFDDFIICTSEQTNPMHTLVIIVK